MPIVIVSDVHANLGALHAVLADARSRGPVAAIWATGDLVGYGAEPAEVLALLQEHHLVAVAGNHDLAACGKLGVDEFNASAAAAALWTAASLSTDHLGWLAELPQTRVERDFTLAHGSLRDPVWEYLLSGEQALVQFELQTTRYSIVGHSHLPFVFAEPPDGVPRTRPMADGDETALGDTRLIINPGSVGQPRDGDPRASYVLYDESAALLTWHRIEYDIGATQQKIIAAGLPGWLADRLSTGT
jgi:diadenosine tetraphosphatase ApaH/serine/threonine PP2A family protein phosphatase